MYYISIRQRGQPWRRGESPNGVQGFRLPPTFSLLWTLGPKLGLECPISFSPFLPFGAFGNTGGKPPAFFYLPKIIYQILKTVPNAHCRQTDRRASMILIQNRHGLIHLHRAAK